MIYIISSPRGNDFFWIISSPHIENLRGCKYHTRELRTPIFCTSLVMTVLHEHWYVPLLNGHVNVWLVLSLLQWGMQAQRRVTSLRQTTTTNTTIMAGIGTRGLKQKGLTTMAVSADRQLDRLALRTADGSVATNAKLQRGKISHWTIKGY